MAKYTGVVDKKTILSEDWGSEEAQWSGADVQKGLKAVIGAKTGYATIYKKYVYTFASKEDYDAWVSQGYPAGSELIISRSDAIKLSEISKTGNLTISYDELNQIISGTSCNLSNLVFKGTYYDDNDKEQTISADTWIEYSVTAISSTNGSLSVYNGVAQSGVTQTPISLYKYLIDNEAVTFIIKASFTNNGQTVSGTASTPGLVKSNLSVSFASQNFWKTPIYLNDIKDYSEINLKVIGGNGLKVYLRFLDISTGNPVLTLSKTMNGDASSSQPFTINPANDLATLTHGVYKVQVYATLTMGTTTAESAKISKNMLLLTSSSDTENFICANLTSSAYTNYTSPQVLQFIINTNSSLQATSHFSTVNAQISEPLTGKRTSANEISTPTGAPEMYTYSTNISLDTETNPITAVASISVNQVDGSTPVLFTETFLIDNTTQFNAADPTSSVLVFDLDPSIQNNNTDIKDSSKKSSDDGYRVSTTWNNLIWGDNEGWITDTENNQSILKLSNGSSMVLNNNLFNSASADNAMTFEIMYKITNTLDVDEPVIQCYQANGDMFRGLKIYPDLIDFRPETLDSSDLRRLRVCDDELIHLMIVCYPDYYGWGLKLAKIYINGKVAREIPISVNFSTFLSALTIGSSSADVSIYRIRKYNSAFNDAKILSNYLNCMTDADQRITVNTNNQIYSAINDTGDNNTGILFENIVKEGERALFNTFVISSPTQYPGDLPDPKEGGSGKHDCVIPWYGDTEKNRCADAVIELYWDGNDYKDNDDRIIRLTGEKAGFQYQGSSSSFYYRYNLRTKFGKACLIYDRECDDIFDKTKALQKDGAAIKSLTFKGPLGSVKAATLTFKKNYASSMLTHKMGNCGTYQKVYNYLIDNWGVEGKASQLFTSELASDIMKANDNKAFVATWQAPFLGFVKVKLADGSYVYRYIGLYTVGPDKSDDKMTGFDTKTYKNFYELEGANQNPRFTNFAVPWKQEYIYNPADSPELYYYNKDTNDEVEGANDNWETIKWCHEGDTTSSSVANWGEDNIVTAAYLAPAADATEDAEPVYDILTMLQEAATKETAETFVTSYCPGITATELPKELVIKDGVLTYTVGTYSYITTASPIADTETCTLITTIKEVDDQKNQMKEFKRRFEDTYKFVFAHSINILPFEGTVEQLIAQKNDATATLNPYWAYWSVQDPEKKLYLYDSYVDHYDVIRQDGDTVDMNVKSEYEAAIASGISATDYSKINAYIQNERATGFKQGWKNYFHDKDTMIWYMNVIINAGTDERAKNIYPYWVGTETDNLMRWRIDDTDTRQDVDNQGKSVKRYWIEVGDGVDVAGCEWSTNSVFFNLLGHEVFFKERAEILYNTLQAMVVLGGGSGNNVDAVMKFYDKYFFDNSAGYFPEQAYNKDAYFCYDQGKLYTVKGGKLGADVDPLTQSLGDHKLGDRAFMRDRIQYLMSMYNTMAFSAQGAEKIALPRQFHTDVPFELKFNKWVYALKQEGDEVTNANIRLPKGSPCTMSLNTGDADTALFGASLISDFGDWSGTYTNAQSPQINFSNLALVQKLKTGGPTTKFNADITVERCPNLRELDIRNCTKINGKKNLLSSTHLESVQATGTNITGLLIANGSPLSKLELPTSVTELYANNLSKLTSDNLKIGGIAVSDTTESNYSNIYKNVEGLLVRNTNNSTTSVDGLELLLHILDAQKQLQESDPSYTPALKNFYIDGFNTTFKDTDADTKLALLTTISNGYKGYSITEDSQGNPYYAPDTSECKMSGSILVKAYYRLNDFNTLKASISNSSNLSVTADSNYDSVINFKDAEFQKKLYNFMVLEDTSYANFVDAQTKLNWYADIAGSSINKMKALCNTNDGTINDRNGNVIIYSILNKNVIPYLSGAKITNSPMYAAIKGQNESIAVSGLTDLSDWGTWFPNSYPRFLVNHECTGLKLNLEYTSVSDFPLSSIVSSNGTIDTLSVHSTGKLTIKGSSNSTLNANTIKLSATGILKFDETAFSTMTNVENLYINSEAGIPDYVQSYQTDMNPAKIRNMYINQSLYWSYIGSTSGWAYRITRYGDKFIPYNFNTNKVTEIPTNPNQKLGSNAIFFNQSVVPIIGTVDNSAIRFYNNSVFEIEFNTSISRPFQTLYFYLCGTEASYVYIDTDGYINFFCRTNATQGSTTGTVAKSTMKVNTADTYNLICDIRNGSMVVTNVSTGAKETKTVSRTGATAQANAYPILLGSYNKFTSGSTSTYSSVSNVIPQTSPFMGNIFSFKLWTNGSDYDENTTPNLFLQPMKTDDGDVYFRNAVDSTSTDEYKDILVLVGSSNTLQYNSATV